MPECFFKFPQHAEEIHCCGLAPGDNVHVDRRQQEPVVSEYFPDVALEPVAYHGTADLFAYGNTEARLRQVIRLPDKEETFDRKFARCTGKP